MKAANALGVNEVLVLGAKEARGGEIGQNLGHKGAGHLGALFQGAAVDFRYKQAGRAKGARHAGQHEADG